MAISPTIGSKNAAISNNADEKHKLELSDELRHAAELMRKKKKSHDEDAAVSLMAGAMVQQQNKKIQFGEGVEKSAGRAASVQSQDAMSLDAIATSLREAGMSKKASAAADKASLEQQLEKTASNSSAKSDAPGVGERQELQTQSKSQIMAERTEEKTKKELTTAVPTNAASQQPGSGHSAPQEAQQQQAVKQDVASQATVQALRDKNTTSGTQATYTFDSWGGNKSVTITSAQKADGGSQFDLLASDPHVKQILDRHLNQDDAKISGVNVSSSGADGFGSDIRSVESSTDKQPNDRQSKGHPSKNNEDA